MTASQIACAQHQHQYQHRLLHNLSRECLLLHTRRQLHRFHRFCFDENDVAVAAVAVAVAVADTAADVAVPVDADVAVLVDADVAVLVAADVSAPLSSSPTCAAWGPSSRPAVKTPNSLSHHGQQRMRFPSAHR